MTSTDVAAPAGLDEEFDGIPYVGPRAFRTGEPLFARDRETHELADLLISEQIVLLHAPSGAGKTSLIRAGLTPHLKQRRFHATMPLRVNTPPPDDRPVYNRYINSVALGLLGDHDPAALADLNFDDVLAEWVPSQGQGYHVLVFDQFEEILTIDPADWDAQAAFFHELGAFLARGRVWALFSMREDYMGGLARYVRFLPGHLRTTYRLDFLDHSAAKAAIQLPARRCGVEFSDEAATELVRRLALVKVQSPDRDITERKAPYVQPVQLQVVCRRLWKSVAREKGGDVRSIALADVERHADIPRALRRYYAAMVEEVAYATEVAEIAIRDWFGKQLITAEGLRSQTVRAPETGDVDPRVVLTALEEAYLIRSDERAGTLWYELTHDLLIDAILDDNLKWTRRRLEPWQLAARAWGADRQAGQAGRLLAGPELRAVTRRVDRSQMSELEREFIDESERAEKAQGRLMQMQDMVSLVGALAFVEALVILVLAYLLWW